MDCHSPFHLYAETTHKRYDMADNDNNKPDETKTRLRDFFHFLGPGLVTGAADDDPSGIATYSQAGAQFGFGTLWTLVFTYPFMLAIQLISARIGRVTGVGIAGNLKKFYPVWLLYSLIGLLVVANTINIGADLAAMGDALQLVIGGDEHAYTATFGVISLLLQIWIPYSRYAPILKWLTLVLFVYVLTALTIELPWGEIGRSVVMPPFHYDSQLVLMIVAIFGTTISPYLFFWQASQEVEEINQSARAVPLNEMEQGGKKQIRRLLLDTSTGMLFSNLIAFFIMVVAGATLHAHGITNIETSAQAAEALRPLAGDLAFFLFASGIIGTGLLAVPVLAGSAAYGVAETAGWECSLEAKPSGAKGFYFIVGAATLIGVAVDFTPLDPIKLLFWSAVINGIAAVPIMAVMMMIASNRDIMGRFVAGRRLKIGGWIATALMAGVVMALAILSV